MNKRALSILTFVALLSAACMVGTMPTGCVNPGGGTNTNVTASVTIAANSIKTVLGPVVIFEENADANSIPDFQLASQAIGVMLQNGTYDSASLQAALSQVVGKKSSLVTLAVNEVVAIYTNFIAASVTPSADAKVLLTAIQDALNQGVKANARRLAAHRRALK